MKAKKLTFSEEALEMMEELRKAGSFRSLSQTVEEIVRGLHLIKQEGTISAVHILLKRLGIAIKRD